MDRRKSSPVKRIRRRSGLKSPGRGSLMAASDNIEFHKFQTPEANSDGLIDKVSSVNSNKKTIRRSRVYNVAGDGAMELRRILAERRHSLEQVDEGSDNNSSVLSGTTPTGTPNIEPVSPKTVPGGIGSVKDIFIQKCSPLNDESIRSPKPSSERRKPCRRLSSSKLNPFGRRSSAYICTKSPKQVSECCLHELKTQDAEKTPQRSPSLYNIIRKSTGASRSPSFNSSFLSKVKKNTNALSDVENCTPVKISALKSPRKRKYSFTLNKLIPSTIVESDTDVSPVITIKSSEADKHLVYENPPPDIKIPKVSATSTPNVGPAVDEDVVGKELFSETPSPCSLLHDISAASPDIEKFLTLSEGASVIINEPKQASKISTKYIKNKSSKPRRLSGTVSTKASPRSRSSGSSVLTPPSQKVKKTDSKTVPGGIAKLRSLFDSSSPAKRRKSGIRKENDRDKCDRDKSSKHTGHDMTNKNQQVNLNDQLVGKYMGNPDVTDYVDHVIYVGVSRNQRGESVGCVSRSPVDRRNLCDHSSQECDQNYMNGQSTLIMDKEDSEDFNVRANKCVSFGETVYYDYNAPNCPNPDNTKCAFEGVSNVMDPIDQHKAFDAVDSIEVTKHSNNSNRQSSTEFDKCEDSTVNDSDNLTSEFDSDALLSVDALEDPEVTKELSEVTKEHSEVTEDTTPRSSVLADPGAILRKKFARNLDLHANLDVREVEEKQPDAGRFHSQPIDSSQLPKENGDGTKEEKTGSGSEKTGGHVRHKTQPITDIEKVHASGESQPSVKGSINERLAKLKQHGEEDWKKRVRGKDRDLSNIDFSHVKLRDKSKRLQDSEQQQQRPKSIADRLSKLENAQGSWKDRVEEKDVTQFTVEGKLNRAGKTTPDSPIVARRRKMRAPLTRAHSSPLPLPIDSSETVSSEMEEKAPTKIEVPEPYDEEFQSFFGTQDVAAAEAIDVTVDDFDHIFLESEDMLVATKKIRPQRKQRTTKNPLKSLAARDDVQSEYTEIRTDIADKELRRIKREQIAGSAGFAEEALAGLASKENFSKVNLRKTDSFGSSTPGGTSGKYEPFKDVMLLQIKGRRHCQVRLVKPIATSLNSGDSFVLVTSDRVYVWIGEYCNIIEKSKATDVAAIIQQKRDLGCKSYQEPIIIYEKRQDSPGSKGFWEALGGKTEYQGPGPTEEDELYEMYMTETNKVWALDPVGENLVELEEYKGTVLPYALLHTKTALVFDFGPEFYVWTGKQVPFVNRKLALRLAKELWEKGYDYSKCDLNPFSPLETPENGGLPTQSETRPEWALFGKVNENMETILFREKFADWPDSSRLIKVRTESDDQKSEAPPELEPYDASKMIAVKNIPVDLLLEGSHIGRGQKWVDKTEGITREFEILTLSIQVWHILEYDHSEVEDDSHGQFHDGDTYVVRWHFMVAQAGRTLKGQEARHSVTGRERCAYFFWQGRNSSINEKGASALMTVELDEERGPQVRVIQGKEPPYFIQLFKGRMITHLGKREEESTNSQGPYRMYLVRNELPKEAYLAEVRCQVSNLRSRGVFLLVNVKTGICHLWIGCKASSHTKDRARELANNLVNKCPLEVGLHPKASVTITEMEEGKEKSEFWSALDSSHRSLYYSLLKEPKPCQYTLRVFMMTSVSGIFEATELLNPCRSDDVASPFPFIQADLYKLSQPNLVMVDAGPEVWVWHGWWPIATEDSDNVNTGSAHSRFNIDRKLALQTTISYCREKFGSSGSKDRAYATYAGLEPLSFTNLFPHWSTRNDVTDIQLQEGRHVGERRKVEDLLVQLNRNNYSWAELQHRPLPDGVDPLRLESYLNDDEFLEMLGMPKEEFYNLPGWKQGNLKKTVGLF